MIALEKTTVDGRTETLIIGHFSNKGTVEHSLDRPGFIEHLLDGVCDLLHGAVLIMKQILFRLGAEVRLGVVNQIFCNNIRSRRSRVIYLR